MKRKLPKPHGPRGTLMLGFGLVGTTLGYSYIAQDAQAASLVWLTDLIPLPVFGVVWIMVGVLLILCSFGVRQARALGAFAGICFFWGCAYLIAFIINVTHDNVQGVYIMVPIFWGLALACGSAVRMVNPAKTHLAVVFKPGETGPRDE